MAAAIKSEMTISHRIGLTFFLLLPSIAIACINAALTLGIIRNQAATPRGQSFKSGKLRASWPIRRHSRNAKIVPR